MKKKQTSDFTDYSGLEELINTEIMTNYNSSIVQDAVNSSKNIKTLVDFGAGIGTLSKIFREQHSIETLCVEVDVKNKEFLASRKFKHFDRLHEVPDSVDFIFSSNVLEHIENDTLVLKEMRDKLELSGKLFLYLPANIALWTKMDEEVGHYRRYQMGDIKEKCLLAGFSVEKIFYADSLGFVATLLVKYFGYNNKSGLGSPSSLRIYDKWIFPVSRFLDSIGFKYLFGKNLVVIANKPSL
ncbi:MAG: hypothetical protein CMM44_00065 [Rhodospirillaceae bacterium]|nr:hypothetical protein [Rhodospirillaceae bacterium]|tara:strand:- start:2568 stop:3290 length:723 start_codon:yes stop_codon:yes gene_type:complete